MSQHKGSSHGHKQFWLLFCLKWFALRNTSNLNQRNLHIHFGPHNFSYLDNLHFRDNKKFLEACIFLEVTEFL